MHNGASSASESVCVVGQCYLDTVHDTQARMYNGASSADDAAHELKMYNSASSAAASVHAMPCAAIKEVRITPPVPVHDEVMGDARVGRWVSGCRLAKPLHARRC